MKLGVSLTALLLLPMAARAAPPDHDVRIDPRADAAMHRMSDYLGSLQTLRVHTDSATDSVTPQGMKVQFVAGQNMTLERPNRLRTDRLDPIADATIRYDGKQLSVYGKRTHYYAIAPMPATLDATLDAARDRYGIDAPAGDLFVSNAYDQMMEDVVSGYYVGMEPIDGIPTHHLAFKGRHVDWQIWIQDGPTPLPLRYSITSKNEPSQPEFAVKLSQWQPNVPVSASEFQFLPPPGSTRIALQPNPAPRGEP
jgi:hypothetical protein